MTTLSQAGDSTAAKSVFVSQPASSGQGQAVTPASGVQLDAFPDASPHRESASPATHTPSAVARAATALLPALHAVSQAQANTPGLSHAQLWPAHQHPGASTLSSPGAAVGTGFPSLDAELPGQGWPCGQITELLSSQTGIGELRLLFPSLQRLNQLGKPCVWVLPPEAGGTGASPGKLPYPPALQAAGLDLSQQIFVQASTARESIWAMEQSLRHQGIGALVAWLPAGSPPEARFRCLRRLQLLAQSSGSLVFLLGSAREAAAASPAALRLQLQSAPQAHDLRLHVHILKRRARPLLEPIALQVHPGSWHDRPVSHRPTTLPAQTPLAQTPLGTWVQRLQQLVSVGNPLGQAALPDAC